MLSDPSFSKKRIYVQAYAAQITHWTDHRVYEKVLMLDKIPDSHSRFHHISVWMQKNMALTFH